MASVRNTPAPVLPSLIFLSLWCFESNPTLLITTLCSPSSSDPVTTPAQGLLAAPQVGLGPPCKTCAVLSQPCKDRQS